MSTSSSPSPAPVFSETDSTYSTPPSSPPLPPAVLPLPPPLPPPPPPPPILWWCDDFWCCLANGQPNCDPNLPHICPGIGQNTPPSFNGIIHPGPHNVQVCRNCIQHTLNPAPLAHVNGFITPPPTSWQFKAQLCESCITDEMELYWRRQNTALPNAPGAPPSLALVNTWPAVAGGAQNLCICEAKAITPYQHCCHICRETAFDREARQERNHAESILRERTRPVISGTKLCVANGGQKRHLVAANWQTYRQQRGITRMCPCGNTPKRLAAQEYITICLACMGVEITPANLPAKYAQPPRRSARIAALSVTKGPRKAPRDPSFRVNIERGWVPNDPFVGGTY